MIDLDQACRERARSLSRCSVEGIADCPLGLRPEGGVRGGVVEAEGAPEDVAANARSFTGQYLAPLLERVRQAAE